VPELIPRLDTLCFGGNKYQIPPDFAVAFVKIHGSDDSGWRAAQQHWERVVERVFDTDAVAPDASGERAMAQAVVAAAELLNRLAQRDRCPLCPASTPPPPREQVEQERV